jgi:hypothetical protein
MSSLINSISASVEFSFKGETRTLNTTLNLDAMLAKHIDLASLHHALAVANAIDTYSYLFEVLQEEEIFFSHPQGDAAHYLHDGQFDFAGYVSAHQSDELFAPLQAIASREMGIADLADHPQLKQALLCAYQLGLEQ